jgi:hypothetical protein
MSFRECTMPFWDALSATRFNYRQAQEGVPGISQIQPQPSFLFAQLDNPSQSPSQTYSGLETIAQQHLRHCAAMSFLVSPLRRSAATPSLARAFSSTRSSQLARMTLVGRLGADPEAHESNNGRGFTRYVIGTDTGFKDNRTTSWFRVTSFAEGPQREFVMGLKKG